MVTAGLFSADAVLYCESNKVVEVWYLSVELKGF
jgi:hypothetical protein